MRVVVLGAGVIGATSAWYLAGAGHEVTVVDRQPAPALETSFANGGQIAASDVEPWANPGAPRRIWRWLGRDDAPLLFRPQTDWQQWRWGLRFLLECLPSRTERNSRHLLALATYSLESLRALRAETGIEYDHKGAGILHFYADAREFERAARHAEELAAHGLQVSALSAEGCVEVEPALGDARDRIAGGTYASGDESGDACKFTGLLAELGERRGVRFRYNTALEGIEIDGGRVSSLAVRGADGAPQRLRADAYVVALGSYSPLFLRPIGVPLAVYPVKGYSITIALGSGDRAPIVSLTDDAYKLVFSRLGDRLRVAGTAELNGYNTELDARRCDMIVRRTFELFPRAGRREHALPWCGLRPSMPSNVPVIGATRYPNLYLNTGHGTLGWTLACGSARALAEIVSGRPAPVWFPFLGHRA